jgi:pilus assembly protein CpaB
MSPWPRPERTAEVRRRVSRLLTRHRRPLAAALLMVAVGLTVSSLRPPGTAHAEVVVASRDLEAGVLVTGADVTLAAVLDDARPDGVVDDPQLVVGRHLAAPVRRGEPLTDVRFADVRSLADDAGEGRVAAPVRLADGEVAALLAPGTLVDVVAADGQGSARVVAEAARVIAVPAPEGDLFDGALVVVSATVTEATALAAAAAAGPLSVTLRG